MSNYDITNFTSSGIPPIPPIYRNLDDNSASLFGTSPMGGFQTDPSASMFGLNTNSSVDVFNPFANMGPMAELMAMFSMMNSRGMTNSSGGSRMGNNGPATGNNADLINKIAKEVGVDPKLLSAIMQQESGGDANAKSECGALGLMQLMPETAESLGVNPHDPEDNLRGGAIYIKQKLAEFGGNTELALAAYNAGSGAVQKYGGIPPYKETQNYVAKIMSNYNAA